MRNAGYFISQAIKNIFRNTFMSLASVFTAASCRLILGVCAAIIINAGNIIEQIKSQCEIQLFINTSASPERTAAISDEILSISNVKSAVFFSREDMLEFAANDMFKGREYELSGFENDNPFSDSYKISLIDISKTDETLKSLEKIPDIDHIMNNQSVINNIISVSSSVKKTGIILMILLFSLSMVIIFNTVKLTVFNRRTEINIMKYIGASDNFIKAPFVIEGTIIGCTSALVSFGILSFVYIEIYNLWDGYGSLTLIPFSDISLAAAAAFLVSGLFISTSGTTFAVKKHLNV